MEGVGDKSKRVDGISCSNMLAFNSAGIRDTGSPRSLGALVHRSLPTVSSSRKNAESIASRIRIRVDLENMTLRSPLGFCGIVRVLQQESREDTVQDAMLNVSREGVCR